MKCAVHPEVDASGYCRNCGRALCVVCARPIRDVFYCEDCLAGAVGIPAAAPPGMASPGFAPAMLPTPGAAVRTAGSPGVAFILGFFPGLGAIYNGEYNKALIHIAVFAAMVVGLSSGLGTAETTTLALLLAGFIFYMAFDAMRTAKAKAIGQATVDPLETWSKERPIGPIILIALGGLFLLNNFNWFPFYQIERFWPVILIVVGVLMFRNRLGKNS
ncbi:MAG TPA: DUF5668 domain-containing protein [Candidatus Dormibacteraeota bacterium]|nr:DUF5668 domain-containing protein [Candidatus Dormibacteraeota bacterium]